MFTPFLGGEISRLHFLFSSYGGCRLYSEVSVRTIKPGELPWADLWSFMLSSRRFLFWLVAFALGSWRKMKSQSHWEMHIYIVSSAKDIMFSSEFVCLFVDLNVGRNTPKTDFQQCFFYCLKRWEIENLVNIFDFSENNSWILIKNVYGCHGYGEDPSAAQEDGMSFVATEPSRWVTRRK